MSRDRGLTGAPAGWIDVALSALVLAVLAAPWPAPSPEVILDRFSSDLITVATVPETAGASAVRVTERALTLAPAPGITPSVHLLTSEVSFGARFSASVLSREGGTVFPLQFKIWHPRTEAAVEAWYAPDGSLMAGMRSGDRWLQTRRLGGYAIGGTQTWRFIRGPARVAVSVRSDGGEETFGIEAPAFPALFAPETLSLTVYATGSGGRATSVIRDPLFAVPRQILYGTRVSSPWFRPVIAVVAVASLLRLVRGVRVRGGRLGRVRSSAVVLLLLVAAGLSLGGSLIRVPGHPLDMRHATLWSLIGGQLGPAHIVGHSLLATEGTAHGGPPYAAVTYPYPPLLIYVFWAAGQAGGAEAAGQAVKILSLLGVVAGGVVIYLLLLRLGAGLVASATAAATYLLNPAILFASAVWGQTDAFVALFLLLASAGLAVAAPSLLWLGAGLASLSKQTGALFAPLLVLAGLARFGPRRLLWGLPTALLVTFLALTPLLWLGVHPAATYRPLATKLWQFGTVRRMESVSAVVSQGSFTVWAALTALDGTRGVARMATPDHDRSRLGLSYFALSRLAFALLTVSIGVLLYRRRGALTAGSMVLALAAYGVSMAVLLTRVQPRYQFFGIALLAASWPWMSRWLGSVALGVLSATMLVGMWGMLASHSALYAGVLPAFDPERSGLNRLMSLLSVNDAAITLFGVLNGGALLLIVVALTRAGREPSHRPL